MTFTDFEVYDFTHVRRVSVLKTENDGRYRFMVDDEWFEYTDYFKATLDQTLAAAMLKTVIRLRRERLKNEDNI